MLGLRMATSSSRDSNEYSRDDSPRRRGASKCDQDEYDEGQYSRRYRESSSARPPQSNPYAEPVPIYQVAPPPSNATTEFERRQQQRMQKTERHERRAARKERRERRREMEERERELDVRQRELDLERREFEARQGRGLDDLVDSSRTDDGRRRSRGPEDVDLDEYDEDPELHSPRGRRSRAPLEDFLRSQGNV